MVFQFQRYPVIRFKWFDFLVDFSFYLAIFGGTLTWQGILPFKVYLYYPIIPPLIIIFILKYKTFNIYLVGVAVLFLVAGIIEVVLGNNNYGSLFKIWSGALIHYLYYYYLLKYYNYDYVLIFKKYIAACSFLAWVAVIQLFSFIVNFQPGYNFSWLLPTVHNPLVPGDPFRAQSLLTEPSTLAIHLIPVVFFGICKLLFPKRAGNFITIRQSILCIIGFFLSLSSTGFFGLAVAFIIIALSRGNFKQLALGTGVGFTAFFLLFNFSEAFQMRLINFTTLIFASEISYDEIGSTDTSNFVLFNNGWVAVKNALDHPFVGTGLGSHPTAYDRYSLTRDVGLANSYYSYSAELNKEDASSLLFRITSETGAVGLILLFFFLIRYNLLFLKDETNYQHWLISNASLVIICTCLLRAGHYFLLGIPMFFIIYYYLGKQSSTKPQLTTPGRLV